MTTDRFTQGPGTEIDRLAGEKAAWLDRLAKYFFPEDIYRLGKERRRLKYVAKWIEEQGYQLREHPDGLTEFCKGETVLAEFKIEFKK